MFHFCTHTHKTIFNLVLASAWCSKESYFCKCRVLQKPENKPSFEVWAQKPGLNFFIDITIMVKHLVYLKIIVYNYPASSYNSYKYTSSKNWHQNIYI